MVSEKKLCKDCLYFSKGGFGFHKCFAQFTKPERSLITGKWKQRRGQSVYTARENEKLCGKKGKYFDPRKLAGWFISWDRA